ncbi:MAG TPA: hypothetical protein VFP87_04605, partial [Chitinophagaceae bacterium]|nr:hypothetical protein [Chitinophagaceae bacterium]
MNGLSVQKIRYLLITLIFFSCVYICFLPLIVSIDSIEGFLTYKQTLHISNFLFRPEVSTSNVNIDVFRFTGYWSPGQWFYPGALNYLLHLKLGVAAIIVTIACVVTGMIGFYKVFRFFDFTTEICLYSLLLIFSSYTFFYSLIVYQGGETLSFGIFPWFLYFVLSARKPSLRNLLIIASLFFLCFFAKLTLLIYCPIIIAFKIVHPYVNRYFFGVKSLPTKSNGWLYSIPIVILSALIYYMFLVRYPLLHGRFNLSTLDFLTPLASPLTSILSLHQIAGRVTAKVPALSVEMRYVIFLVLFLFFGYMILSHKGIDRTYKFFLMMLYTGICVFFICS